MKSSNIHVKHLTPSAVVLATSRLKVPATLQLNVCRVPTVKGHIMIAVYANERDFMKKPIIRKKLVSTPGNMSVELDLPLGDYSVVMFHDQTGDGMLSRNKYGIPTEPWTTSASTGRTQGKPTWIQTRFSVTELVTHLDIRF